MRLGPFRWLAWHVLGVRWVTCIGCDAARVRQRWTGAFWRPAPLCRACIAADQRLNRRVA